MALADVYDALVSRRVYKSPMSHEQAKKIIIEGSGKHFDADIVQAFLADEDEFIAIAARFEDGAADL
jgi:putative two-component system response regulator